MYKRQALSIASFISANGTVIASEFTMGVTNFGSIIAMLAMKFERQSKARARFPSGGWGEKAISESATLALESYKRATLANSWSSERRENVYQARDSSTDRAACPQAAERVLRLTKMFRSFNSGQLSERLFSKSLTLLSIAIACVVAE